MNLKYCLRDPQPEVRNLIIVPTRNSLQETHNSSLYENI